MAKKITNFVDLIPDPNNANRGTERGRWMIEQSIREGGGGRSGLADRNGVLMAGNKTAEVAAELGLKLRVVHTTGDEWVVVQRDDLDMESDPRARRLALADNRSGEVSLEWDTGVLAAMVDDGTDMRGLWSEDELHALIANGNDSLDGAGGALDTVAERWLVLVECAGESEQVALIERFSAEGLQCRALIS